MVFRTGLGGHWLPHWLSTVLAVLVVLSAEQFPVLRATAKPDLRRAHCGYPAVVLRPRTLQIADRCHEPQGNAPQRERGHGHRSRTNRVDETRPGHRPYPLPGSSLSSLPYRLKQPYPNRAEPSVLHVRRVVERIKLDMASPTSLDVDACARCSARLRTTQAFSG